MEPIFRLVQGLIVIAVAWALLPGWKLSLWSFDSGLSGLLLQVLGLLDNLIEFGFLQLSVELVLEVINLSLKLLVN